jgi:transcription elongation factor GreB
MSKAFTREDDFSEDAPLRPLPSLPPGVKNYITAEGAENLRGELQKLESARAGLAKAGDRAQISNLDQRIARLEQILASVAVVTPSASDEAKFGANVTVKYPAGDVEKYRIVGVNEIDLERNYISWQSPLAKALLNRKVGDVVRFRAPAGEQKLEILAIEYP